jgi:hypothetical protein
MNELVLNLQSLIKAMEAGQQGGVPGSQSQGNALAIEDLSPIIQNVCINEKSIKLQKLLKVEPCKSMTPMFTRQLDYGQLGGSAQLEGAVGVDKTSTFGRSFVPMCFYSHLRRVTTASNMVDSVDGKKAEERAAEDAAKNIALDIEFDLFRGKGDFSNNGVFDGNPLAVASSLPNMMGVDQQVRSSDMSLNSHDLMMEEYGSNASIVVTAGGILSQANIEDASVKSAMNAGDPTAFITDPMSMSAYNKSLIATSGAVGQRIMLGGAAQQVSGADFRGQWVNQGGEIKFETSRLLAAKTTWARTNSNAPGVPSIGGGGLTDYTNTVPGTLTTGVYRYIVTAFNEYGESAPFGLGADVNGVNKVTVSGATTGSAHIAITAGSGTIRGYNIYRTAAGAGTQAVNYKFVGRVAYAGATTNFIDLGNKLPGSVTGFLYQDDTMAIKELAPYSRQKMAQADLSITEAHFRFCTLVVYQPRKNVLIDNITA